MNKTMKNKLNALVFSALIAAIYAALTIALSFMSYGAVQFRISEALTVLPYFSPYTVFGLIAGCLTANIFSPYSWLDIVFGTLATAVGAAGTYLLGKKKNNFTFWLAPLPTVISNTVIVGMVLTYQQAGTIISALFFYNAASVLLGEAVCCYGLGLPLMFFIKKYRNKFNKL